MQLTAPPGFGALAPFDRDTHRALGIDTGAQRRIAAGLASVYLNAVEFARALPHFPVVFAGTAPDVVPVAVTGFEAGRSLITDAGGVWPQTIYQPAYLRLYPFHTVRIRAPGSEEQLMLCVDESGLSTAAPPLLSDDGASTARMLAVEQLARDFDAARTATTQMIERLLALDLLVPFSAQVLPESGAAHRLDGLLRVEESRLNALPAQALAALARDGMLSRVYAHLLSLDRFASLLARAGNEAPGQA